MHAFFAPFGIYPNNAIVGGSGSIAPGAALFKRVNRKPGIVVANIGDASFGCGPVWEGITFSAMDQYRKLWDEALGGGLPIIFNCMNNFYGMGGQPLGETMGVQSIARVGAGVNPEQMHAERVNGYDPLPVIDAFRRKKQVLLRGPRTGPARHGHLPHQRPFAFRCFELPVEGRDRALAAGRLDPRLPRPSCSSAGVAAGDALDARASVRSKRRSSTCSSWPSDLEASPRVPVDSELVGAVMFSNRRVEKFDDRAARVAAGPSTRTRACSRFAARSARRRTTASRSRR